MKKNLALLGFILGAALTTVLAQPSPPTIITLDETGNGTWFPPDAPGPTTVGFILEPDPSHGAPPPNLVLIYTIPGPSVVLGDVLIYEATNTLSDVLRFYPGNHVIFYSDSEGVFPRDHADSGLPPTFQTNNVSVFESGPEGNNSAAYTAFAGMPGWDGNPSGTTYQIISDVPEPTAFSLSAIGGGL